MLRKRLFFISEDKSAICVIKILQKQLIDVTVKPSPEKYLFFKVFYHITFSTLDIINLPPIFCLKWRVHEHLTQVMHLLMLQAIAGVKWMHKMDYWKKVQPENYCSRRKIGCENFRQSKSRGKFWGKVQEKFIHTESGMSLVFSHHFLMLLYFESYPCTEQIKA